jgi:hypothetical protein
VAIIFFSKTTRIGPLNDEGDYNETQPNIDHILVLFYYDVFSSSGRDCYNGTHLII